MPQLQITVEREQGDSGDLSKVVSAAQTQKQAGLRVAVKKPHSAPRNSGAGMPVRMLL